MKQLLFTILFGFSFYPLCNSQEIDSIKLAIQKIEASLEYKTGVINLIEGNAKLTVPDGFRYLDKAQSIYVLTDLWGNPKDSSVLGMIVPSNRGILDDNGWAFIVSYEDMGYVEDDDAEDIDYNDLLKDMQKETTDANVERVNQGFESVQLVGWASPPHYDASLHTLHWAKELAFGDATPHTLNYNLRILGRKGLYNVNAVAGMPDLPEVQSNIDKIIKCVTYNDGFKYTDFDSKTDNVAAWTIGGLVAGKVLGKVGFFALIAKFWKIIFIALAAGFGSFMKFFKKDQRDETPADVANPDNQPESPTDQEA